MTCSRRPEELASLLEEENLRATDVNFDRILGASDGFQSTGEELATAHHTANVLFNVMRGGIPANGYLIDARDVVAFIQERSPATAQRCAALLADMPEQMTIGQLLEGARASRDPDLHRMARSTCR